MIIENVLQIVKATMFLGLKNTEHNSYLFHHFDRKYPIKVRSLNDCPCHDNCPLGCNGCDNWTCYEKLWEDHGSFPGVCIKYF